MHDDDVEKQQCSGAQVQIILHHVGFYPYHIHRVQHFLPGDQTNHVQFFKWLQTSLHILGNILFTDEFILTGMA
jgi:hypothetical protein